MQVAEIELYKILRAKFSEQEAETIVAGIGKQIQERFEDRKNDFATKGDVSKLEVKIAETKAEIIKWMFIFWIGQLASTIAIIKLLFH